ncbi:MAG: hypothetical protein HRU15_05660 [Planctomycetes bacterium]|nr:hypothetical protein [Planctomycetota bacterium]
MNWTKSRIALLGTCPDSELAKKWDVSHWIVRDKRLKLGIPTRSQASHARHDWSKIDALCRTLSDREVSEKTGIPKITIRNYRVKNNISHRYTWRKKDLALLGAMNDHDVARRIGVSPYIVSSKRKELGIVSFREAYTNWTRKNIQLLGTMSDQKLAQRMGVGPTTVHSERVKRGIASYQEDPEKVTWTAGMDRQLGTCFDKYLADEWGISNTSVAERRKYLEIEAYGRSPANKHQWTQQQIDLLGTDTDKNIAHKMRLSRNTVLFKRRSLDIAPYKRG